MMVYPVHRGVCQSVRTNRGAWMAMQRTWIGWQSINAAMVLSVGSHTGDDKNLNLTFSAQSY